MGSDGIVKIFFARTIDTNGSGVIQPLVSMLFNGHGPSVQRCDGFDVSFTSTSFSGQNWCVDFSKLFLRFVKVAICIYQSCLCISCLCLTNFTKLSKLVEASALNQKWLMSHTQCNVLGLLCPWQCSVCGKDVKTLLQSKYNPSQ